MSLQAKVQPSLLAADFGALGDAAVRAEQAGGDGLHVDIMDGHFVPNLSMGPDVVRMARERVALPLYVHLMLTNPDRFVDAFAEAGSDTLLIHIEAACDVPATLEAIRARGVAPGITLNPGTPAARVFPVLDRVTAVLCMTVNPGYGGQAFMPQVLPEIRALRARLRALGRATDILVDGGITRDTVPLAAKAGANVFVAGTALFRARDMAAEIAALRERARPFL